MRLYAAVGAAEQRERPFCASPGYQAKGIEVALDGTDEVEGHKAYRLNITMPSGSTRRVWVDVQTFFELKNEHTAARRSIVSVFYRNYRAIDGLQIPMTIETAAEADRVARKMTIDEVTLNPSLSDAHFERPSAPERRKAPPGVQSGAKYGDVSYVE